MSTRAIVIPPEAETEVGYIGMDGYPDDEGMPSNNAEPTLMGECPTDCLDLVA